MTTENLTQEEITKSVTAAYDSVSLINDLLAKLSLTEDETDTLVRNKKHLTIMLGKEWFAEALTVEQKAELEGLKFV